MGDGTGEMPSIEWPVIEIYDDTAKQKVPRREYPHKADELRRQGIIGPDVSITVGKDTRHIFTEQDIYESDDGNAAHAMLDIGINIDYFDNSDGTTVLAISPSSEEIIVEYLRYKQGDDGGKYVWAKTPYGDESQEGSVEITKNNGMFNFFNNRTNFFVIGHNNVSGNLEMKGKSGDDRRGQIIRITQPNSPYPKTFLLESVISKETDIRNVTSCITPVDVRAKPAKDNS